MKITSRMRIYWRLACLCLALLVPLGCAQPATNIHLVGTIDGQQMASQASAAPVSAGVAAHISCDHHTTTASAAGAFTLDVPLNSTGVYTCVVSAAPNYQPQTTTLTIPKAGNYLLSFSANTSDTACQAQGTKYDCPLLQLVPGKIVATLTYHDSQRVVANAHVRCTSQYAVATNSLIAWHFSESDAQGRYSVAALPPGNYTCIAYDPDFVVMPSITVPPGQTVETQATICELHCPRLRYHDGVTMHAITAYLIYWLPAGKTFDPANGSAHYEQTTGQFIADVSDTPYYHVLTQYGDFAGPIQNTITVGGVYVDPQPYPHAGTQADPLTDTNIQNEIIQAQQANSSWTQADDSIFIVFTSYNSEECNDYTCSFNRLKGFCGYHDTRSRTNYALILDTSDCVDSGQTPNDVYSDAAIDILDHEIAEAATDPKPFSGWNNDALNTTPDGGEIGDLCYSDYASTLADGGDITLHGHDYFIQPLWSNRTNGCAFSG